MSEVVIVANPISGRGKGEEVARALGERLQSDGWKVDICLNGRPPDVDAQSVVSIGGDGTLRGVAQWLVERGNFNCPILVVPMGTANLMGQALGLDWGTSQEKMVEAIKAGQIRHVDVAWANQHVMLLVAGAGLDGAIVHELARVRTGPIRRWDYLKPTLHALRTFEYPSIQVSVDGKMIWPMGRAMVFVANVKEYGTGFSLLPEARPDDRKLDVCVIPCSSARELPELFLSAAAGVHLHDGGAVFMTGRKILIEADRPVPVEIDGEAAGFAPVRIELMEKQLPFIVSS